jgi:hypothetical protein
LSSKDVTGGVMGKCIVAVASVVALVAAGSAWATAASTPPGTVILKVGQTERFAAARLRPGETIRCVNNGHVLSVEAPASPAISNGTVWTRAGTTHFHLHVTAEKRGGFVVDCGLGGFHWAPIAAGNKQPKQPPDWVLIA